MTALTESRFNIGAGSCGDPKCDCIHLLIFLDGNILTSLPLSNEEWDNLSFAVAKTQAHIRKKQGLKSDG